MQSEKFGRFLKAIINSIATQEGKTNPIVEDELGQKVGVSAASIQRYKAGHIPPELRTIEIFVEAAVKRGGYSRDWLQNFLHSAQHPNIDKVLDQLCPTGSNRLRSKHIYHNLPAPTYSQFVMREQPFNEILDGLRQRSAAVLIVSMGGMGKTSLAREVADFCLKEGVFDAVVWVSDKDQLGTTNLSRVLDEVARTLDYPGFTKFEFDEKKYEVEQLLRRQRILLILDNFETVTDSSLTTWLLRIPEPSKALITSRQYSRTFRNNTNVVDLHGMTESEATKYVQQHIQFLKLGSLIITSEQIAPLLAVTGGNPKAISMALGCIKYERRPLRQVVDDLYNAQGDIFDDLFTHCWSSLDEAARRILFSITFFADSASEETLSITAGVKGFALSHALERLTDFTLLDVKQESDSMPRYTLHPLVKAFAELKLRKEGTLFEPNARNNWKEWYKNLAFSVGYCYYDFDKLSSLNNEFRNTYYAMQWCFSTDHLVDALTIAKGIDYYFYITGLWYEDLEVCWIYVKSAELLNDLIEETHALSQLIVTLSVLRKFDEAEKVLSRLQTLLDLPIIPKDASGDAHTSIANYYLCKGQLDLSLHAWDDIIEDLDEYPPKDQFYCYHFLSIIFYKRRELEGATNMLGKALKVAENNQMFRGILTVLIRHAVIALDKEDIQEAEKYLLRCQVQIKEWKERPYQATITYIVSRFYALKGDLETSLGYLEQAVDLFERVGMKSDLALANKEYHDLQKFLKEGNAHNDKYVFNYCHELILSY